MEEKSSLYASATPYHARSSRTCLNNRFCLLVSIGSTHHVCISLLFLLDILLDYFLAYWMMLFHLHYMISYGMGKWSGMECRWDCGIFEGIGEAELWISWMRIASSMVNIWTSYLPNTSVDCHCLMLLLIVAIAVRCRDSAGIGRKCTHIIITMFLWVFL